jgi:hypothetical protein
MRQLLPTIHYSLTAETALARSCNHLLGVQKGNGGCSTGAEKEQVPLEKRFASMARNFLARGVAKADQFMPG